jgi:hypothetical protein
MALLGLIGGPLLIFSSLLIICGVYDNGSSISGLLTLPEAAWELSLGVYCAWKGFRASSPILRAEITLPAQSGRTAEPATPERAGT